MAKQKVYFIIERKNGKFKSTVVAENGKCLDPSDPQTRKETVIKSIKSLIQNCQDNEVVILDTTKVATLDLNLVNRLLKFRKKKK
jgi:hypothetical protein